MFNFKCVESDCFDEVILNTDLKEIANQALDTVSVYYRFLRDSEDDKATSEEFVRDFIKNNDCDYLFQIHTIAPLLKQEEITNFVHSFIDSGKQVGLCYEKIILETTDEGQNPINFTFNKKQNSQELKTLEKN